MLEYLCVWVNKYPQNNKKHKLRIIMRGFAPDKKSN